MPYMASSITGVEIRTDPAPGFQKLKTGEHLKHLGINLDVGNKKNKNKVALVDTKIKEFRKALLKASTPLQGRIDLETLARAMNSVNDTIRQHGLSAKEIHFGRDRTSHQPLKLIDTELAADIQNI